MTLRPEIAVAIERAEEQRVPPLREQGPEGARRTHVEQSRVVAGPPELRAE